MQFIKRHFWNIFFIAFIAVIFLNPMGIGTLIRSNIIRIVSISPSSIQEGERVVLTTYNWNLQSVDGETLDFNTLKGKVVFVNIWATWCPPCVAEMPSIESLYKDYGNKIEFIILAHDNPLKVNPFIDKNGNIVIFKKGAANWNSSATRKIIDGLL